MKNTACRTVRRELDESEVEHEQTGLSKNVQEHLRVCGDCQLFYQSDLKLRRLVGGLGTVEAPADFEFRLRAKLAEKRAGPVPTRLLTTLRLWSPAIAGLIIFLVVGLVALRLKENGFTPTISREAGHMAQEAVSRETAPPVDVANINNSPDQYQDSTVQQQTRHGRFQRVNRRTNSVHKSLFAALPHKTRIVSTDFSSTPAPIVRRDESIANARPSPVFPIDAPYQSVKLSLDDSSGISRTITLPTISFGSQRAVAPTQLLSNKGVW